MSELKDFAPAGAMFDDPKLYVQEGGILAKRFGVVPFSVLDTRQGAWQRRKRDWIALGIKGEEGRTDDTGAETGVCVRTGFMPGYAVWHCDKCKYRYNGKVSAPPPSNNCPACGFVLRCIEKEE